MLNFVRLKAEEATNTTTSASQRVAATVILLHLFIIMLH